MNTIDFRTDINGQNKNIELSVGTADQAISLDKFISVSGEQIDNKLVIDVAAKFSSVLGYDGPPEMFDTTIELTMLTAIIKARIEAVIDEDSTISSTRIITKPESITATAVNTKDIKSKEITKNNTDPKYIEFIQKHIDNDNYYTSIDGIGASLSEIWLFRII